MPAPLPELVDDGGAEQVVRDVKLSSVEDARDRNLEERPVRRAYR